MPSFQVICSALFYNESNSAIFHNVTGDGKPALTNSLALESCLFQSAQTQTPLNRFRFGAMTIANRKFIGRPYSLVLCRTVHTTSLATISISSSFRAMAPCSAIGTGRFGSDPISPLVVTYSTASVGMSPGMRVNYIYGL